MVGKRQKVAREEFAAVGKKGRRLQGRLFSVTVLPNTPETKVSFVVSKAVAPKATDRNRLKRLGYSLTEGAIHFREAPHRHYLWYFKKGANEAPQKVLEEEFKTLFRESQKTA